jgi:hypothetical protein
MIRPKNKLRYGTLPLRFLTRPRSAISKYGNSRFQSGRWRTNGSPTLTAFVTALWFAVIEPIINYVEPHNSTCADENKLNGTLRHRSRGAAVTATFELLVLDGLIGDRVSSRKRFRRTRSGRLIQQVRDVSARVPGCQVFSIRAEAVGDGPIVRLTLLERSPDRSVAA